MRLTALLVPVIIVGALTACDTFATACAGVGIPGIEVDVRDPSGAPALPGAMVVAATFGFSGKSGYADTVGPVVPSYDGSLRGPTGPTAMLAENRRGSYIVTASKPHWTPASQAVEVPGDKCGNVETQRIRLTISMSPTAPRVRSVAVAPRSVRFGFCRSAIAADAFVEADAGLSGSVTWHSEDTTVVTVDDAGIVTVKSRGLTRVGARSVADSTVVGYLVAQVEPVCP